ncbi:MAG: hypothetical protein M1812_006613 [Candelaria pacifica]|nr:MAG: hypothetical protein M1812_006613 [Candelaria pacifica]
MADPESFSIVAPEGSGRNDGAKMKGGKEGKEVKEGNNQQFHLGNGESAAATKHATVEDESQEQKHEKNNKQKEYLKKFDGVAMFEQIQLLRARAEAEKKDFETEFHLQEVQHRRSWIPSRDISQRTRDRRDVFAS